jgi:hypothetical protein
MSPQPSPPSPDSRPSPALGAEPPDDETPRPRLLAQLLQTEVDLDQAFDRLLHRGAHDPGQRLTLMKAVVPGDALISGDHTLGVLLTSVLAEYEEIERLIEGFREAEQAADGDRHDDAIAFVSEAELADPQVLARALQPLSSESARFEFLFEMAKRALERLDIYQLSQKGSSDIIAMLRHEQNLRTVQSLVEFLRSLNIAADSFESLDLPQPHIRDYLKHLYMMKDWQEMGRLVQVLEIAVSRLFEVPSLRLDDVE